jgi:hypothetical protein
LPGIIVLSMNRIAPPTGLQARPVDTPTSGTRLATSGITRFGPSSSRALALLMRALTSSPSATRRASLRQTAQALLQLAHARLPCILLHHGAQPVELEVHMLPVQPAARDLARHQVLARDLQLLVHQVAGKVDHLHAVAQRPGHAVQLVGRGDEHHL